MHNRKGKKNIDKIFMASKMRSASGIVKSVSNTAQNLYLNDNANKIQHGGDDEKNNETDNDTDNGKANDKDNDNNDMYSEEVDSDTTSVDENEKKIKHDANQNGGNDEANPADDNSDTELDNPDDDKDNISEADTDNSSESYEDDKQEQVNEADEADDIDEIEENEKNEDDKRKESDVKDKELNETEGVEAEHGGIEECLYQYDELIDPRQDDQIKEVSKEENITDPHMTYYEKNRILGVRSKQIEMGSKIMVKTDKEMSSVEYAIHELKHRMTPLKLKRPLPNGIKEIWDIKDMIIDDDDSNKLIDDLHDTFDNKKNIYELMI